MSGKKETTFLKSWKKTFSRVAKEKLWKLSKGGMKDGEEKQLFVPPSPPFSFPLLYFLWELIPGGHIFAHNDVDDDSTSICVSFSKPLALPPSKNERDQKYFSNDWWLWTFRENQEPGKLFMMSCIKAGEFMVLLFQNLKADFIIFKSNYPDPDFLSLHMYIYLCSGFYVK